MDRIYLTQDRDNRMTFMNSDEPSDLLKHGDCPT
jgi:hypothetical protein